MTFASRGGPYAFQITENTFMDIHVAADARRVGGSARRSLPCPPSVTDASIADRSRRSRNY